MITRFKAGLEDRQTWLDMCEMQVEQLKAERRKLVERAFKAGQQAVDREGEPYNEADSKPFIDRVLAEAEKEADETPRQA